MRDVVITGACCIEPTTGDLPRPERWALRVARLARMDRLCALALVAADGALLDAGFVDAVWSERWDGDRAGVVVGSAFGCHATNEEYHRGMIGGGLPSPRLFAYTLPSSPLGEIAIHYGARGPAETVVTGRHAGVEAIERAARLVATARADRVVLVAVDVTSPTLAALGLDGKEGAAAIVLEDAALAAARGAPVRARFAGAATAFRDGRGDDAARAAMAIARDEAHGIATTALDVRSGDDAVAPVAALVAWLASGHGEGALVCARDRAGGAAALLVARQGPRRNKLVDRRAEAATKPGG